MSALEHLIYLLAISISFNISCWLMSFPYFYIGLFSFFDIISLLYVLQLCSSFKTSILTFVKKDILDFICLNLAISFMAAGF